MTCCGKVPPSVWGGWDEVGTCSSPSSLLQDLSICKLIPAAEGGLQIGGGAVLDAERMVGVQLQGRRPPFQERNHTAIT